MAGGAVAGAQTAFWEAECTRRQEALIEAEELQEAALDARAQAKAAGDRERKARKKAKRKVRPVVSPPPHHHQFLDTRRAQSVIPFLKPTFHI